MTRKHFTAIAATVKNMLISDEDRFQVATDLADTLAEFNPHFDRDRFIEACKRYTCKW